MSTDEYYRNAELFLDGKILAEEKPLTTEHIVQVLNDRLDIFCSDDPEETPWCLTIIPEDEDNIEFWFEGVPDETQRLEQFFATHAPVIIYKEIADDDDNEGINFNLFEHTENETDGTVDVIVSVREMKKLGKETIYVTPVSETGERRTSGTLARGDKVLPTSGQTSDEHTKIEIPVNNITPNPLSFYNENNGLLHIPNYKELTYVEKELTTTYREFVYTGKNLIF